MQNPVDLLAGLGSLALAGWFLFELWHAARSDEIRGFLRTTDRTFPRRRDHPVMFWASVVLTAFVVVVSLMVAMQLLLGIDLRWWL